MYSEPPFKSLLRLCLGALRPPPGRARIAVALGFGVLVHSLFAVAVLSMIAAMYFGMSRSFGSVPAPWFWLANLALVLQFPLVHSALLSKRGQSLLSRVVPGPHGSTLSTTTYATIASLQLTTLFLFWTPSGTIWWEADGLVRNAITTTYAGAWFLLIKASYDAGAEVQSGALGWLSLLQDIRPRFPDMPTTGLFRLIRQPIYASFALTLWTVPVWTPDQLMLATVLTAYCLLAPLIKERRFIERYGDRFESYRTRTPYILPLTKRKSIDARRETQQP
ncbi:MAG: isoprenylcysteine carboxylmethyltransferase family protein [Pseudomonadota bacterium]